MCVTELPCLRKPAHGEPRKAYVSRIYLQTCAWFECGCFKPKKTRMWFWLTKNNKCSIRLSAWLLFVLCVMLGPVRGRVCHACVTEVSRVRHGSVTRVSRKDFRGPKTHKHAVWTQSTYNSSKSANESRKHVLCINFPFLSIQNHIQLFYSDSRLSESHTTFWTSNVS